MPTDLTELMDLDPLGLTKSDLDEIISYHRANRAKEGADGKMPRGRKAAPSSEKPKMSLEELLGGALKKPATAAKPAIPPLPGTGPRRI